MRAGRREAEKISSIVFKAVQLRVSTLTSCHELHQEYAGSLDCESALKLAKRGGDSLSDDDGVKR